MTESQTWVVRYLRIDGEQRRLPLSHACTVEVSSEGEGKMRAFESLQQLAAREGLEVFFLDSERIPPSNN